MINSIIMASGYGRRMGGNKLILSYKNKTLVEHIIEKVMKCNFCSKVIVAKDEEVMRLARNRGITVVKNDKAYIGQSQSIKLGIKNSPKADGYMFFTADQPLLDIDTIKLLMDIFEKNSRYIIIPRYKDKHGSPVIFPIRFINELMELEGDNGGKVIINNHKEDVLYVDIKKEYVLLDVDTKEDYGRIINMKG